MVAAAETPCSSLPGIISFSSVTYELGGVFCCCCFLVAFFFVLSVKKHPSFLSILDHPVPQMLWPFFFFCFFFFFGGASAGFELKASYLLGRHFYCLSHSTSPFFVVSFFNIGSHELFAWDWLQIAIFWSLPWVARITGASHWCRAQMLWPFTLTEIFF
jgi:hypothetical protein